MFVAKTYRSRGLFRFLLCFEFATTIAGLTLTGIASPNLYRDLLWQDGADNGFNSSPNTKVYAFANYRPYSTPIVWSQFITDYNLVIYVLSMFFMLVKICMFIVNVFRPWLSLLLHCVLTALYAYSIHGQSGHDMTDPDHPQDGPPWYITKSCSVTKHASNIGYCKQAKSLFAVTIIMLVIFCTHIILAAISSIPTKKEREAQRARKAAKAAKAASIYDMESALKSPAYRLQYQEQELQYQHGYGYDLQGQQTPFTPGSTGGMKSPAQNPYTPRTMAFNTLGGTKDLPLRNHFSSPQPPSSPTGRQSIISNESNSNGAGMYFPPPPKQAAK